jgi:hypothetical protein
VLTPDYQMALTPASSLAVACARLETLKTSITFIHHLLARVANSLG